MTEKISSNRSDNAIERVPEQRGDSVKVLGKEDEKNGNSARNGGTNGMM